MAIMAPFIIPKNMILFVSNVCCTYKYIPPSVMATILPDTIGYCTSKMSSLNLDDVFNVEIFLNYSAFIIEGVPWKRTGGGLEQTTPYPCSLAWAQSASTKSPWKWEGRRAWKRRSSYKNQNVGATALIFQLFFLFS